MITEALKMGPFEKDGVGSKKDFAYCRHLFCTDNLYLHFFQNKKILKNNNIKLENENKNLKRKKKEKKKSKDHTTRVEELYLDMC